MDQPRNREEVINTQLAIFISKLGVTADAETIHVHGKHRPDVLFSLRGLRVALEGKFADHPAAKKVVLDDAQGRVRNGIAHIAVATVYPLKLRTTPTAKILGALETATLQYRIVSEAGVSEDWFEGTPVELMAALRRVQDSLAKDDIVAKTAESLSTRLEGVAKLWLGQEGACDRLAQILGITPPRGETPDKAHERRETSAKVAALVLANAFIFEQQLADTNAKITSLRNLNKEQDLLGVTAKHWNWIWQNINYTPIFQLGERVLNELPLDRNTVIAVRALLTEAISICSQQSALRHDLMGRIYHWLLHYAKYLGTYYTSVSAATLLLNLAIAAPWSIDFGDPAELAEFKVADLACGTGTLLMATAQALSDAYIRKCAEADQVIDMPTLHRTLMENVLHGYDVLPSALHLTASTLAMLAPEVTFVRMNLYVMPLGMDHGRPRLGSLDFLEGRTVRTQMSLDYSQMETIRTSASSALAKSAQVPKLSLCVMNPPFVRSVGGNLLFGSLPDERGQLQAELKRRVKTIGASATAGLGSVFVALADSCLRPGGRLAFVLPAALASGEAWGETRKLLATRYHLETIISSHDAERPNFSENTALSELLFIARKLRPKELPGRTTYISLWRNPRSIHEAMDLANRIVHTSPPTAIEDAGITTIGSQDCKLGEVFSAPATTAEEPWAGVLFAQTELMRTYWGLLHGKLHIPGHETTTVPVCQLKKLGELGYDRRDIHDAFEVSTKDWSPYPAFWGHDSETVRTIAQSPTATLLARSKPMDGRKLKSAEAVWQKAGRILLAERLWPVTHRLLAVGFDRQVLGNTWWALQSNTLAPNQEKALLLWLNSSLALLLYFGHRVVTRSAWMQMKKPGWASMPVLNVGALDSTTLDALTTAYERLAHKDLSAIAHLDKDAVRSEIDDSICQALGLPGLNFLRQLFAREPGLTAHDIPEFAQEATFETEHGENSELNNGKLDFSENE
jgi:hypothetical protein